MEKNTSLHIKYCSACYHNKDVLYAVYYLQKIDLVTNNKDTNFIIYKRKHIKTKYCKQHNTMTILTLSLLFAIKNNTYDTINSLLVHNDIRPFKNDKIGE